MPKKIDSSLTLMIQAVDRARSTMNGNAGGPFGALVADMDGKILAVASNSVLKDHDPTAHAEVNAIRAAGIAKGTHDLSGCILYTTCYPCPMCLGAIIWANIKTVVYGCRKEDADQIGFRDDFMWDYMRGDMKDFSILSLTERHREECLKLFQEYKEKNKELY